LDEHQLPDLLIAAEKSEITRYPVPKPIENFLSEKGY
jgi:hypothetical protein